MVNQILSLWFGFLLALPASAFGHLSLKTRVGGYPDISPILASKEPSQLVETHQEKPGADYDSVSGVHKYLYCHADPVNGIDPSGKNGNLLTMQISMKTAIIISAIALPAVMEATWTIKNHTTGNSLNSLQQTKVDDARKVITQKEGSLPADVKPFVRTALNAKVQVHDTLKARGEKAWATTQLYGQWAREVFHVDKDTFLLDKRLFASLLIHEAVHVHQWIPAASWSERPAYQMQSDVLRAWGLTANSIGEARILFPGGKDDEFLDDIISAFDEYQITNPAWTR